jgi:hypothetical protein
MIATTNPPQDNGGVPAAIDFSATTRGKFYRPGLKLNLPVHLKVGVSTTLFIATRRSAKNKLTICFIDNFTTPLGACRLHHPPPTTRQCKSTPPSP